MYTNKICLYQRQITKFLTTSQSSYLTQLGKMEPNLAGMFLGSGLLSSTVKPALVTTCLM